MKKSMLTIVLALMAITNTWAYDVEVDGIYYKLDQTEQTAQVTSGPEGVKYSGHVAIPSSIIYDGITYPVTSIGMFAFDNCYDLTSVEIPNSVTTIIVGAFAWCTGLTSIEIPNSVDRIPTAALQSCTSLKSIVIPNSVKWIAGNSFMYCSSLTSVVLPNSLFEIGSGAFEACSSLTSIDIPNSVELLGFRAFASCSNLATVTLGTGLQEIRAEAFADCTALNVIVCNSPSVIICEYNVFDRSGCESGTLYVPSSLIENYRTANQWSEWGSIKTLDDWAAGIEIPETNSTDELRIYSIDGRKLPEMQHGLNIVNGKKILKK